MQKPLFDTLNYATILKSSHIEHPETHTQALVAALAENIYSKTEVNHMIEDVLKKIDQRFTLADERIDQRFREVDKRFTKIDQRFTEMENKLDRSIAELHLTVKETEIRFERALRQNSYAIVGILSSLILVVGSLATFAHHLF